MPVVDGIRDCRRPPYPPQCHAAYGPRELFPCAELAPRLHFDSPSLAAHCAAAHGVPVESLDPPAADGAAGDAASDSGRARGEAAAVGVRFKAPGVPFKRTPEAGSLPVAAPALEAIRRFRRALPREDDSSGSSGPSAGEAAADLEWAWRLMACVDDGGAAGRVGDLSEDLVAPMGAVALD